MNVSDDLSLRFLRRFARFEFALKRHPEFCMGQEGSSAHANWDQFAISIAVALQADPTIDHDTRALLLDRPPMNEVIRQGVAVYEPRDLGGGNDGARLVSAARRIRNNLFHGGKDAPERYAGHDEGCVTAALCVLDAARKINAEVCRLTYES